MIESVGHVLVLSELSSSGDGPMLKPQPQEPQQCPICLDTISDTVQLSCSHRFCWKCFVLGPIAFQPGEYRITQCPICRRETQLEVCRQLPNVIKGYPDTAVSAAPLTSVPQPT